MDCSTWFPHLLFLGSTMFIIRNQSPEMSERTPTTHSEAQTPPTPRPISRSSSIAHDSDYELFHSSTNKTPYKPEHDFFLFDGREPSGIPDDLFESPPMSSDRKGGLRDKGILLMSPTDDLATTTNARRYQEAFTDLDQLSNSENPEFSTRDMFGTATLEIHGKWHQNVHLWRSTC